MGAKLSAHPSRSKRSNQRRPQVVDLEGRVVTPGNKSGQRVVKSVSQVQAMYQRPGQIRRCRSRKIWRHQSPGPIVSFEDNPGRSAAVAVRSRRARLPQVDTTDWRRKRQG